MGRTASALSGYRVNSERLGGVSAGRRSVELVSRPPTYRRMTLLVAVPTKYSGDPVFMIATRGYASHSATTSPVPFQFERRDPGPNDVAQQGTNSFEAEPVLVQEFSKR